MRSEAGYVLAILGEGGSLYHTTFRVEIVARKFKKNLHGPFYPVLILSDR